MYLHMKDPQLNLAQFGLDKLAAQAHKELTYMDFLWLQRQSIWLVETMIYKKTVTYDKEDLETLLEYNIKLFYKCC